MKNKLSSPKFNWPIFKIVAFNWFFFAWLVLMFTLGQLHRAYDEKSKRLDICQNNMAEIEKQIESGRIILQLKK